MTKRFLYHGTGIYSLVSILATGELRVGAYWGKPGEPHGPRLTEDYTVAKGFIANNIHWGEGGVLVFDRTKLAEDYDLVSYSDTTCEGVPWPSDEREVAIAAPVVRNLDRYLVSAIVDPAFIERAAAMETIFDAEAECGWCYGRGDEFEIGVVQFRRDAHEVLRSPFLNAVEAPDGSFPTIGNWKEGPCPTP